MHCYECQNNILLWMSHDVGLRVLKYYRAVNTEIIYGGCRDGWWFWCRHDIVMGAQVILYLTSFVDMYTCAKT